MTEPLTVWAPAAERVEVSLPGGRHPLQARDGGWWATTEPLAPGTDYLLHVDGGPGLPDPRSPWQPEGVHGPARTFDARAFEWTDAGWRGRSSLGAVIYELHVGTFTPEGTLDAAIGRLDHLVHPGVAMVELMPVAAFRCAWTSSTTTWARRATTWAGSGPTSPTGTRPRGVRR